MTNERVTLLRLLVRDYLCPTDVYCARRFSKTFAVRWTVIACVFFAFAPSSFKGALPHIDPHIRIIDFFFEFVAAFIGLFALSYFKMSATLFAAVFWLSYLGDRKK